MSELEEFEKWYSANCFRISWDTPAEKCLHAWKACSEKKDTEIAALRGYLLEEHRVGGLFSFAERYGLIDEDGNPTKLLTGENK